MANAPRLSINEKKFIEEALRLEQRVDGRRPFDSRRLSVKFAREDGVAEVQLGQTHVMGIVTAQLVQPYRDRPNEGTLSIFTEFSPMADPTFEVGRPGEFAVELGRIADRGLRESRAVDTESLCVLAGKAVWALRVDLNILDNGGNLVDAANVAALAALLSFRRPECSVGGQDGQEITIHPPEIRDPLPLIIHHLPIAVTFAFFGDGDIVVLDPILKEEAVMGGRMTVTMNTHGDICAVQKGGGVGVSQSEIMRCFRIASMKAADITAKLKDAVEALEVERAQRKIRRHRSQATSAVNGADIKMRDASPNIIQKQIGNAMDIRKGLFNEDKDETDSESEEDESEDENGPPPQAEDISGKPERTTIFAGGPSKWDPYSKGIPMQHTMEISPVPLGSKLADKVGVKVDMDSLQKTSLATQCTEAIAPSGVQTAVESKSHENISSGLEFANATDIQSTKQGVKAHVHQPLSLEDSIKLKARKKKKNG